MNARQTEPRQNFNSYIQSDFRNALQQPVSQSIFSLTFSFS